MDKPLQLISVAIFALIICGLIKKRNRQTHRAFMLTAFGLDLLLVLYIELTRDAITTALHPPHPFVMFHVFLSVMTFLLYFVQIGLGMGLWKEERFRKMHRWSGIFFLLFRFGNLLTSFWVQDFIS